ncbi:MAG TPA: phosphatidate cytidylyltransferase [Burkholderiaceae bacterium]|nr:phosphatidate cytidylyltransferase [Burkholderiaceae bacterium]
MLGQRVATAVVLLAILLPAIFVLPAWTWAAVTLLFLAVGTREWTALLQNEGTSASPQRPLQVAIAVLVTGLLLLAWRVSAGWPAWFGATLAAAATAWWCVAAPLRLAVGNARGGGWPLAATLLLACWVALIELHALGAAALLAAMAIVWIADIAAYFVGRAIGRRKLAPRISPGKSWEGAIGGALAVVLAAVLVARTSGNAGSPASGAAAGDGAMLSATLPVRLFEVTPGWLAVALFVLLAALSVVGDLHESLLKRQAGVKDSGTLLPGHGGVLDRIDALIPVMPAVLLLHWLAGSFR